MGKSKRLDMLAGMKYPAIRRPNPVIEASDIEAASYGGGAWTWASKQDGSQVMGTLPARTGEEQFEPSNSLSVRLGLVGPCGIPRSEWGLSPYQVGPAYAAGLVSICRSDSRDCARCPMNPHRVENEE